MDLRRHNRGSRQYMQPSPAPPQSPQLFEDTSQYGAQTGAGYPPPMQQQQQQPFVPAQQPPTQGGDWQSYDLDMVDYTPPGLPPYDPFNQQQQQQHQQHPQQQQFNNNQPNPMMGGGRGPAGPYGGPAMGGAPVVGGAPMGGGGPMAGGGPQQVFNPQQFLNDPMASMALQYGQTLAGQGREIVHEKIERYVSISKLKYYFAVDTSYVANKLFLLVFPFMHKDWAPKYNQEEAVPPRFDVNAPDLYIPSMAFVSYILLSAYMMGLEDRFSPEVLGMQASSSMGAMVVETCLMMSALYIMNINTYLKLYDLLAFCGYKFVAMLVALVTSLLAGSTGYMLALLYCSFTLGFFLLRTLRIAFLSNPGTGHFGEGSRRSLYVLLGLCFFQPLVIWFMTHSLLLSPAKPSTS